MLKCTISGFINETVIDTSENITKYLKKLKQLQEQNIGVDLIKIYNKTVADQKRRNIVCPISISANQHDFPLSIKIEPMKFDDQYF